MSEIIEIIDAGLTGTMIVVWGFVVIGQVLAGFYEHDAKRLVNEMTDSDKEEAGRINGLLLRVIDIENLPFTHAACVISILALAWSHISMHETELVWGFFPQYSRLLLGKPNRDFSTLWILGSLIVIVFIYFSSGKASAFLHQRRRMRYISRLVSSATNNPQCRRYITQFSEAGTPPYEKMFNEILNDLPT